MFMQELGAVNVGLAKSGFEELQVKGANSTESPRQQVENV